MSATRATCQPGWRWAVSTAPIGPARAGGRSCRKVAPAFSPARCEARYYYLYATDGAGGSWEGKTHFCTAPGAKFLVPGRNIAPRRGFDQRGFFEVDTGNIAGMDANALQLTELEKARMRRQRKTKIVATLGPASNTPGDDRARCSRPAPMCSASI